ncbi:heat-inducible transcription repressor HrcA [Sporobacter termitidis DSM 10068]|uniref:Heat-inducible transcription repressor HrcA n=1 Tax=Sporobacter termitidis DSM 10068 TaxID=1123282 RepID=A0A1M5Z4L7_9FIRM|nr:heat-inducible transcriptional repressor HrcA [Sporobacter termitidis]SHI19192.1 heat-inducible transcription repressor HrcA [Sporobacter termitidis DSM 10068]
MDLGERKKRILRAVIDQYVETAEPVGSKAIAGDIGMNVSPATIRNEMAELESMGLLEQPHTSAGRIPTPQGYRMYVNELMRQHRLSLEETETINRTLKSRIQQLDKLLTDVGRLTSQLVSLPAYALSAAASIVTVSRFDIIYVDPNTFIVVAMLSNKTVKNKLVQLPFPTEQGTLTKLATLFNASFTNITEDRITTQLISSTERAAGDEMGIVAVIAGFAIELLYETKLRETHIAGTSNLLEYPEYRDVEKAQRLLRYLSDEEELLRLPGPAPEDSGGMKITIGPENLAEELRDSSVIVARYDAGDDMQGLIGVVGPTRMDYSKVAARLGYIARGLSWLLSGGDKPPGSLAEGHDKSPP